LRIAEIYETNLGNYLAAALEYEEILKKKLPAERWGWAAIHLANLYSGKLNKTVEATKLLRRIVDEYGQTVAAKRRANASASLEPIERTDLRARTRAGTFRDHSAAAPIESAAGLSAQITGARAEIGSPPAHDKNLRQCDFTRVRAPAKLVRINTAEHCGNLFLALSARIGIVAPTHGRNQDDQ